MRLLYTKTGTGNDSDMSGLSAAPAEAQRIEIGDKTPGGDASSGGVVLMFVPVDGDGIPLEAGSMTFSVQAYRAVKTADDAKVSRWVGSRVGDSLTGLTPYEDIRIDDFETPSNSHLALRLTDIADAPVGYAGLQVYGQGVA